MSPTKLENKKPKCNVCNDTGMVHDCGLTGYSRKCDCCSVEVYGEYVTQTKNIKG